MTTASAARHSTAGLGDLHADKAPSHLAAATIDAAPSSARTLWDVFVASATARPSAAALEDAERSLTYAELLDAATTVAKSLNDLEIGRGDRVGIQIASGTVDLYTAILGVLCAGAAYVPVDIDDPEARRDVVFAQSDVAAVLKTGLNIVERHKGSGSLGSPRPDDDCWIIFTSGSTGLPKGVAATHRSATAFVDAETLLWHVGASDRVQAALSVGFDASCEEIWLAWRNGASLVATPRSKMLSPEAAASWIRDRAVTVVSTVPTIAALWPNEIFDQLRLVILGGEACSESLADRLVSRTEAWNTYGPTEATVVSTAGRLRGGRPTIGEPLAGWKIAVIDDSGQPVVDGSDGELVIGGVGLARYLDKAIDEIKYAALPALGWERAYRTGDRVRVGPDGLDFIGRIDDQVKINGRRVELGEIDAALSALPGVLAGASAVRETAAGNRVLVGYVIGDLDLAEARSTLSARLPGGLVPLLAVVNEIPRSSSGKVNRAALPWPLETDDSGLDDLGELGVWLTSLLREHLGPVPITSDTDFFAVGGNSLAAAKFVSAVRIRYPTVGIADLYSRPHFGDFAAYLSERMPAEQIPTPVRIHRRRFRWLQLVAVGAEFFLLSPRWLAPLLIFNVVANRRWAPSLPIIYVVILWLVVASLPGRLLTMAALKKLLLRRLTPGRYPRGGRVHLSIWFLERVADTCGLEVICGTPWARRYARLMGAEIDKDVSLSAEPPVLGMLEVRSGSTIEAEVTLANWYFERDDIVIGPISVGRDVRVGARSCLMPGTVLEDHCEIESGSCISGTVNTGERWEGSPAQYCGRAGSRWPLTPAPRISRLRRRLWDTLYGLSAQGLTIVPVLPAIPALLLLLEIDQNARTLAQSFLIGLEWAPLLALSFLILYGVTSVALVRFFSRWVRPGLYASIGWTAYCEWMCARLLEENLDLLSPVYSSLFTPIWLRILGSKVGKNVEIATPVAIPSLLSIASGGFVADDVFFAQASSRQGWMKIGRVEIGERSFVGNSALLDAGTYLDEDALIAVMSRAPRHATSRTSWLGSPSVEIPRTRQEGPLATTFHPKIRLKIARGAVEVARAVIPATVTVIITECVLAGLDAIGSHFNILILIAACPLVLGLAAGAAWTFTLLMKWAICGRYRPGIHALWSNYVWRTEFVNAVHDHVAGAWFTPFVLGTEIYNIYLRTLGVQIGNDVWCETPLITEFDLVEIGDGASISATCDLQTHLFHDRMMRVGGVKVGAGSTIGTHSVVLPEAELGESVTVGPRSLVMRGESLASGTSWQGIPIIGA